MGFFDWVTSLFKDDEPQKTTAPQANTPVRNVTPPPRDREPYISPQQAEIPTRQNTNIRKPSVRPITPKKRADDTKVWVGLDFGTSYTKAAYKVIKGSGKIYGLDLSTYPDLHPEIKFAQPSVMAFSCGRIYFGDEAELLLRDRKHGIGIRHIKLIFAGDIDKQYEDSTLKTRYDAYCQQYVPEPWMGNPGFLMTAYIVWITRRINGLLKQKFPDHKLKCNFNICIPIDTYQASSLRQEFQRVVNVAEELFESNNNLEGTEILRQIATFWGSVGVEEKRDSFIHLVPESIAQMACYFNSLTVENKVHGVIDFGAGTTDFSIFNLSRDEKGERCSYWYNAATFPHGMRQLEEKIFQALETKFSRPGPDQIQKIMAEPSRQTEVIRSIINNWLNELWQKTSYPVWGTAYAKRCDQSCWTKENVKIFLCGGGSRLPQAKEIFKESWYQGPRYNWGPYQIEYLSQPENFDSSNLNSYYPYEFVRMAVAYGLTYPRPELVKYVLPKDCPDQTPKRIKGTRDEGGYWGAVYVDTK